MERLIVTVRGRVQMVMYRAHAYAAAQRLGITGYVMNQPDGSVAVVAEGERSSLDRFIEALRQGSFFSRVDSVDTDTGSATGEFTAFTIRYE